jgi:pyridoxal phosphate enzyme (YggS family)
MTTNHIQSQVNLITNELNTYSTPPQLLVATKYASTEETQAIINNGIHLIGENKVQDALVKKEQLTPAQNNIQWHMIGHLQRNKINKAIDLFDVIQSLDSLPLLEKLNAALAQKKKTIAGYLQVNIGNDPNKFGFSDNDILTNHPTLCGFQNITIKGIMIVTPLNSVPLERRALFKNAYRLFEMVKNSHPEIKTLSMGMSNDYKMAIEEGSTMVRLGKIIFKRHRLKEH